MATKNKTIVEKAPGAPLLTGDVVPLDGYQVTNPYATAQPAAAVPEERSGLSRGAEVAARQIPQTFGGMLGLIGDSVGSDGLRDYGMGIYKAQEDKQRALQRDSDSFSSVLEGKGDLSEFAKYGTGYVGMQALSALVTGGLGGFVGRKVATTAAERLIAEKMAERVVAEEAAKRVAASAASKGMTRGAGAALGANNFVQEAGSIYPEALEQAQQDGRTLTGADLARVAGSAAVAAGVETLTDTKMLRGVLNGASSSPTMVGRLARNVPASMAREAGTEGVQTAIERFGAQKDLTNGDAIRDYVDSAALGGLGGGLGGAAGSIRQAPGDTIRGQKVAGEGPAARAVNAGIEAQAQAADAGLVPEAQAAPAPIDDPIKDQIRALPAVSREDALRAYAVINNPDAPKGVAAYNRKLLDRLLPDPAAQYAPQDVARMLGPTHADPLQGALAGATLGTMGELVASQQDDGGPVPIGDGTPLLTYDQSPTGTMIAGPDGVRPETRADAINAQQAADQREADRAAEEQRRIDLGLQAPGPRPVVEPVTPAKPVAITAPEAAAPEANRPPVATPIPKENTPQVRMDKATDATKNEAPASAADGFPSYEAARDFISQQRRRGTSVFALPVPRADGSFGVAVKGSDEFPAAEAAKQKQDLREAGVLDADILNKKGAPFTIRLPAANAAKAAGPEFEPVQVKGGWVARKKGQADVGATVSTGAVGAGDDAAAGVDTAGGVRGGPPLDDDSVGGESGIPAAPGGSGQEGLASAAGDDGNSLKNRAQASADIGLDATKSVAPIEGKKIDGDWTSFSDDSGTLKIPRAEMPQIKSSARGALVNFLAARGVGHETAEVPASDLKPTQAEFSPAKVKAAKEFAGDRSILVSSDGHVLDGHHQWMSKREQNEPVSVIRLDAPIKQLLADVREFPSAETAEGSTQKAPLIPTESQDVATKSAATAEPAKEPKSLEQAAAIKAEDAAKKAGTASERDANGDGQTKETSGGVAMFSRSGADSRFAADVIAELGALDGMYRHPVSSAQALPDVLSEVDPTIKDEGDATREDERHESGADSRHLFRTEAGRDVYVYERGNKVWMDVSRLENGQGGDAIYQAVANYAHNTGKVFVGDPAGLSKDAVVRRTYHMLGSAIRFGTTEHFLPAREQLEGLPEQGVPPLEWKGNDGDKLAALVKTFTETTFNANPKLRDYSYDFGTRQFIGPDGNPVSGDSLLLGMQPRAGTEAGGYRRTPAAAVFLDSLARQPSGERPGLLALADRRPAELVDGLKRPLFSKDAQPRDEAGQFSSRRKETQAVVDAVTSKWEAGPKVVVIDTMADAPEAVAREYERQNSQGATGAVEGFYHRGEVYLVADQLATPGDALRVLYHEALGHAGLRGAFGKALAPILDRMSALRAADVRAKAEAYGLDFSNPRERRMAAEEVLAELAQTKPEIGWVRQAVAAIRSWLRENVPAFKAMTMSDDEIVRQFILPARRFVERGELAKGRGDAAAGVGREAPAFSVGDEKKSALAAAGPLAPEPSAAAAFRSSVDQVMGSLRSVVKPLTIGRTPEVLKRLGAPDLEVTISRDVIRKATNGVKHHVTLDAIKALPEQLASPVMVFDSKTHAGNSLVVLTEFRDEKGAPVVAAVHLSKEAGNRMVVNDVASVYGRGPDAQVVGWVKDGLVRYSHKEKSLQWFTDRGLQLPKAQNQGGQSQTVLTDADLVKQPNEKAPLKSTTDGLQLPAVVQSSNEANADSRAKDGSAQSSGDDGTAFSLATDARDPSTFSGRATAAFNDVMGSTKVFNGWWHKTVGTQYHKAARDADFKRVFDATQNYIGDVSRLSNDAADLARNLLPKMERFADVLKHTKEADVKAIAKPIFQGTLADKRVYSRADLKRVFGLTDHQADLYKEFHAATAKSLDILTTSTIAKMVEGKTLVPRSMLQDELDTADHAAIAGMLEDAAKTDPSLKGLSEQVREASDRAEQLKGEGYAPLMRFGQYAVSARDNNTNALAEFYLFESQFAANRKARELEATSKFKVDKSLMSQEDYKLLGGVSPESLELFGDILERSGVMDPRNEVFQQYVRNAVAQRSAMKRMLERQGYPGYSTDVRRVLASFITSNARLASKNHHFAAMLGAADSVPKHKGDVRDEAIKLVHYVQNPVEEASQIRGLLFVNYIGGSVASALVNMTQSLTMTLPYLSQHSNPARAAATIASAMKQAATSVKDKALADALARAEGAGVVSPQEIHHLNAEAMKTFGSNPLVQKGLFLWGSFFSAAEQFNRRAAFIAGWNTAVEKKLDNPYEFAQRAVEETQGVYNKGNRPNWARGALGATLFTFKQFSISYLEFLSRLPAREKALALGVLMLAAGAEGMPFADDLDDLIDTIAQRLGYSFNAKQEKRRFLAGVLGQGASDFMLKGVSGLSGMPVDIAGRMGMANLLPGTGLLRQDVKDHMSDVFDFAGPVGGVAQDALRGTAGPTAIKNLAKGIEMFQTGEYRDTKGRRVIDVDAADALFKSIGFQPAEVARESLASRMVQQNVNLAKNVESSIAEDWAKARLDGDEAGVQAARQRLADWNEKNPDSRIAINQAQIANRLRQMKMSREDRIIKAAPRELRAETRATLQQ